VLVSNEGLAILNWLKIQSDPLGNPWESSGDEMNLHMPQDAESESELKNLAATPWQIISPANNKSIIGFFQDSLLGCYRYTRATMTFTVRDAMNLMMMFKRVDPEVFTHKTITNFDLLTQILPPTTIKFKTKQFNDEKNEGDKNSATSNNILEIKNGVYLRGQLDKDALASGSKGLIHRICNDFGNMACANFIDDMQNIITSYLKTSSFSVGISDLIANQVTNDAIVKVITGKKSEVKNLIDQVQLGIFENNTGKTNEEEFEMQVNNILNQAQTETGKIGLSSLGKDNRFVIMVNAGSKGSDLNISFMISALGQQNVEGKRIPYGFESRTLPHFTKFDDSPAARGFVESSYINGLSPQELFFHAMGGRIGLIDTAVKTSTTGYIQRRLIKGLEDIMVGYDMTLRNSKNKVVQFTYGDDGFDPVKVEFQSIPTVSMNIQEIYEHFSIVQSPALSKIFVKSVYGKFKKQVIEFAAKSKLYTDLMIHSRKDIIQKVFNNKGESVVKSPVAFAHIINGVQGQQHINASSMVDITPLDAYIMIEKTFANLEKIRCAPPNRLFKILYYYYLSPRDLLLVKRFNLKALTLLLDTIVLSYKRAIVAPGEMVGMIAAQSVGEPTTQMSERGCEHIKVIKLNKAEKKISMISGEIGRLCDDLIARLPEATFSTGHPDSVETLLEQLDDEYYIVGVDEKEKTHWNRISHVSRHPVNGDLMKVTTKSGRITETTLSHSHLIRDHQTVMPITGADLQVGMRIPVAKHLDNPFVVRSLYIKDTVCELDYLFGWFIGAYLAEGHLTKKTGKQEATGTITITNIAPQFIENTRKFAERFDKSIYVRHKQGEYGPGVDSIFSYKPLADFIMETCGNGSFVKRVPDFAFTAPNEFKAGLIQAYMDGDGNFQCDKGHHQIRVCSRSKQLIKDMALLLNYFDIFGSIKENTVKGSSIYNLAISSKYSQQYKESIDTQLHGKQLEDLIAYDSRENVHDVSDEIDKINGLGDVIAKCGKTLALPGQSRNYGRWAKKESIGRRTLQKYIKVFEEHANAEAIEEELTVLRQAAESGVIWDEIVKIEIYTPDQTEYVYDFTVPANQTFMTDYGIIVHNTLNTFHFAGVASKSNVTRGVPRIEEILQLSAEPKNPSLTVYLKEEDETNKEKVQSLMYMLENTKIEDLVKTCEIYFDPDNMATVIKEDEETMMQYNKFESLMDACMQNGQDSDEQEKSKWILRIEFDPEVLLEKNITMDDISFILKNSYGDEITCVFSDYNSDKLIMRLRMNIIKSSKSQKKNKNPLDQSDQIYLLKNFQDNLLQLVVRGVKDIKKVIMRKIKDNIVEDAGTYKKQDIWVLDTVGTNIVDVLSLDYIDHRRTTSNDIVEIYNVFGIEAARQAIYAELVEVIEFDDSYVNFHHLSVLCDRMTYSYKMISIFRHGINNDNIGPIAKASFEETPEMFLKAARHAELDTMRGISANVMVGQEGLYGTSAFQVVLDIEEMKKLTVESEYKFVDEAAEIAQLLEHPNKEETTLKIQNDIVNIKVVDTGKDDEEYDAGF
jgi:DNA-directed RNA polymerase beta' subunit